MNGPTGNEPMAEQDHLVRTSNVARDGWKRTLEDVEAMLNDRQAAGYETLFVPGANTAASAPDTGETDEWGLSYIVGSEKAEEFLAFYKETDFDETAVYQAVSTGYAFVVTELIDHDTDHILFVAGSYQLRFAGPLVRTATERGEMQTHLRTIDGTTLAVIEHDDVDAFFPEPQREQILSYGLSDG